MPASLELSILRKRQSAAFAEPPTELQCWTAPCARPWRGGRNRAAGLREAVQHNVSRARKSSRCVLFAPNDRGSVTVEYAVVLLVVALGCVFVTVALGRPLVAMFITRQVWLELAFP